MNKKPDWAQWMVDILGIPTYMAVRTNYQDVPAEYEPQEMVLVTDLEKQITALLRANQRKVKRMVQNLKAAKHGLSAHTLDEVLAKLKEMER